LSLFAILICSWGRWVLDKTATRWIFNYKSEGKLFTVFKLSKRFTVIINLLVTIWILDLSQWLHLLKTFYSFKKISFNGLDLTLLGFGWDFKTCLWDFDCCIVRLDNSSIKSNIIDYVNFVSTAIVFKFGSKLDLRILITTMFTAE